MIIQKSINIVTIHPEYLDKGQAYKRSVAYFGGTFDPFHLGHFLVTNELCSSFDEVWVHPHNFSTSKEPIALVHRQEMVLLGIKNLKNAFLMQYHSSSDQFYLPHFLEGNVEGLTFTDVIGDDHLDRLIAAGIERSLYCFAREEVFCQTVSHPLIHCMAVNTSGITATDIRTKIKKGALQDLPLQRIVLDYIKQRGFYQ